MLSSHYAISRGGKGGASIASVSGATYPTKIPTVLIFQWTISSDGGSRVQVRRETERKRGILSVVGGRAKLALGCSLIREPLHDVCRIIVD